MMKTIIDADSISYLLGWTVKDLEPTVASYGTVLAHTDQFVKDILIATKADEYIGFLGGVHATFRHLMNREYKANRGQTKPDWWNSWGGVINHRLRNYWKFYYVEGIEAEDAVSMMAHYLKYNDTVVAHIDKDLNQIPGAHYNYKTQVSSVVTSDVAAHNLYKQVMTGDSTDNLPGLPGIGEAKAKVVLDAGKNSTEYMMLTLNKFVLMLGEREGIIKFTESYAMVKLLDEVPADLNFKPNEYKFLPSTTVSDPFNLLKSAEHEIGDNSQYFTQPDPVPQVQDKQISEQATGSTREGSVPE